MIDFEKQVDRYVRDLHAYVYPLYAQSGDMLRHAVSYAQIGLKWAFLLNGGALVALPTLSHIFDITSSILAVFLFITGLALSGLCSLAAYLNFINVSALYDLHASEHMNASLQRIFNANPLSPTENLSVKKRKIHRKITFYQYVALVCGFSAYVAFVVGCVFFII